MRSSSDGLVVGCVISVPLYRCSSTSSPTTTPWDTNKKSPPAASPKSTPPPQKTPPPMSGGGLLGFDPSKIVLKKTGTMHLHVHYELLIHIYIIEESIKVTVF